MSLRLIPLLFPRPLWRLSVAFIGGLCFGLFSPAVNIAVNDPFHRATTSATNTTSNNTAAPLVVAHVNLCFAGAFWLASWMGNVRLLQQMQQASVWYILINYLMMTREYNRLLALAAGIVCAVGNLFRVQGGQMVGYATADLVQAYPLVSTVWDVCWFGEFQHVRPWALLSGMYVAYLSGVMLLARSSME